MTPSDNTNTNRKQNEYTSPIRTYTNHHEANNNMWQRMAYESPRKLLYSTSSSSRIGNRRTQYWRNKSYVCCCPWQTLLIHTRTNTTLLLNNSTGHSFSILHRPTRYTWYAPSDMYSDIYPFIYQQFYWTRSLWITYIKSDVCIHASNKI